MVRHIEYLLQRHGSVVLPGIGAFKVYGREAMYSTDTESWTAPAAAILFDPEDAADDNMLRMSLEKRLKINSVRATAMVEDYCHAIEKELALGNAVVLGSIGTLSRTNSGAYSFAPVSSSAGVLSPKTMWLPDFKMPVVATASDLAHELSEQENERRSMFRVALRRAGQAAAGIAAVFAIGWVISHNMESPEAQMATLAPTHAPSLVSVPGSAEPALVLVVNRQSDGEIDVAQPEPASEPTPEAAPSEEAKTVYVAKERPATVSTPAPAPVAPVISESDAYCLVIASLTSMEEAEKYISKQGNQNMHILTTDGRFRVYAATGSTPQEAVQRGRAAGLTARYPGAWACHR